MFDPQPQRKTHPMHEADISPLLRKCEIHSILLKSYKDGTYSCITCAAQMAVKNLSVATGFYPRMKAIIPGIEADVIDNMFRTDAEKKGISVALLFSMLLSEYALRHTLTIDQVMEKISSQQTAIMILPS